MTPQADRWAQTLRALSALAIDPYGLKGMRIRARVGPVRQKLEDLLAALPDPRHRIHTGLTDTELFGGLDVSASLSQQKLIRLPGLAAQSCSMVLPMAERTPPGLAARLAQLLDNDLGHTLVLLDEGVEPEEAAPNVLLERVAFDVELNGMAYTSTQTTLPNPDEIDAARARLGKVRVSDETTAMLTVVAAQFGISSLRAPQFALKTARAFAALANRDEPSEEDLREAAELVYASRARMIPELNEDEAEPDQKPEADQENESADDQGTSTEQQLIEDLVVAAIAAQLPQDILEKVSAKSANSSVTRGSGAGTKRKGNRRGRPLPSRPGRMDGQSRIDIVATLRSAAPFQVLRRRKDASGPKVVLYPSDIRLKRFEDKSDRVLIFLVDASGSAAMARMAEAKGAVELMLAQAYSKRDQVALIAFRGTEADILLPPTRSLVQAKRRLAGLPGGGGTPLAKGLLAAAELALQGRAHGLSPSLIVLTDGRANIDLNGEPGRDRAVQDAQRAARQLSHLGVPSVMIDTAARPGQEGEALAQHLGSHYLALPRADAERISAAADAALAG